MKKGPTKEIPDEDGAEEENESVDVVEEVLQRTIILSSKRLSFHPFFDKHNKIEYTEELLEVAEVPDPKELRATKLQRISTVNGLQKALEQLEKVSEIGVALFLTGKDKFMAEVIYLVISSDEADYCIDVKRVHDLILLAPIFLDPKVTKIIRRVPECLWWLQEEQGLYVANVFELDVGLTLVNDALPEIRSRLKKLKLHVDSTAMIRFDKHEKTRQQRVPSNDFYVQTLTHVNVYMYRLIKKCLLAQFGVQKYLEVKHAMDAFCKFQYVDKNEILRDRALHNIRRNQGIQKKALSGLWTWRRKVAIAENINPHRVLHIGGLVELATSVSRDPFYYTPKDGLPTDHVVRDIEEVLRILNGSTCTSIIGQSYDYHVEMYPIKSSPVDAESGNDSNGGVKRNPTQRGPSDPSSAGKRKKLQQHRPLQGNLRSPQQQADQSAFQSGTSYNTIRRGNPQSSRSGYHSDSQSRGSFGGNSGSSRRDSGNFRDSGRDDSGNTRDISASFCDSRNRSAGFRGDGRSSSNRSSSGNFNRSADSFSRISPRDILQSSGNVRSDGWDAGSSAGNASYSGSFGNSFGNFGNVSGGRSGGNFGQSFRSFVKNIDEETVMIDKQIQLLQKQLEMKRLRQMLDQL